MARRKQAVPLQREVSDFHDGPPESPNHGWKNSNGGGSPKQQPISNGRRKNEVVPQVPIDQAGFTQLLICVGGIYASL